MRRLLFPLLLITFLAPAMEAQVPSFGGCGVGRERGYVRVSAEATLREWDTGRRFVTVLPGDELRFCRYEADQAIVTVWSRGYGYRLPRSAVGPPGSPVTATVSPRVRDCLIRAIEDIQLRYRSREQGRHLLLLARQWNVTLHLIGEVRASALAVPAEPAQGCAPPDRGDDSDA